MSDVRVREAPGARLDPDEGPLRFDGDVVLSGRAEYVDDVAPPGMLHAAIHRSPHPHARIRAVRTEAAAAMPGVRAVLTGEQVAKMSGPVRHYFDPLAFGFNSMAEPALAVDKVRWVGDPVAIVAAETPGRGRGGRRGDRGRLRAPARGLRRRGGAGAGRAAPLRRLARERDWPLPEHPGRRRRTDRRGPPPARGSRSGGPAPVDAARAPRLHRLVETGRAAGRSGPRPRVPTCCARTSRRSWGSPRSACG